MDLEKVLEIANECVDNDIIPTEGLTIGYKLDGTTHKKLDEEVIEINLAGITFVFEIE